MKLGGFFCSCARTSSINYGWVKKSLGKNFEAFVNHHLLCTDDGLLHVIDYARMDLIDAAIIGCTGKNEVFNELAEKLGIPFHYINLREQCGWVHEGKEATEKAKGMIAAKIAVLEAEEDILPHALNVGSSILMIGSTPEVMDAANMLSRLADVRILAEHLKETGRPGYGVKVYLGRLLGITGGIGSFAVKIGPGVISHEKCVSCGKCTEACPIGAISHQHYHVADECDMCLKCARVCPVDAISFDREPFEVRVDQVVGMGLEAEARQGVYPVTADIGIRGAALEAVVNIGKRIKPLAVEADLSSCAAGKSGIVGCTLCESACAHGAIEREGDAISFNHDLCEGCGACAAVCPVSIPKFRLAPREGIHRQLEALLRVNLDKKVAVFTCRRREEFLDSLGRERRMYHPVLPVFVPCLNAVSELEILGAFVLGADGVVLLGCEECLHGAAYDSAVGFSREVLDAFNIGDRVLLLRSAKADDFPSVLEEFALSLTRSPVAVGSLAENKRRALRRVLRVFSGAARAAPGVIIEEETFGLVEVNDSACTLCNTCSIMCPQEALRKAGEALIFYHERCIACGLCVKSCPEKAITMKKALHMQEFIKGGGKVVSKVEILRCPSCGRATISKNALRATAERLRGHGEFDQDLLRFCPDCRALRALGFTGGEKHG
jgi:ferredoxin/coenzyme F420-reducing hydrogenase delta subunit